MNNNGLLTIDEIAVFFKTTKAAIYQRIKRGTLPQKSIYRVGKRIYFNKEKLVNWLEGGCINV